jgi:hypothetical protein
LGISGGRIAHGGVTRRPPISLDTIVCRTEATRTPRGLGFVRRSRANFCRPVPTLSVTIRNCFIAVRHDNGAHHTLADRPANDRVGASREMLERLAVEHLSFQKAPPAITSNHKPRHFDRCCEHQGTSGLPGPSQACFLRRRCPLGLAAKTHHGQAWHPSTRTPHRQAPWSAGVRKTTCCQL